MIDIFASIFVIHNNEKDRLDYLLPSLNKLVWKNSKIDLGQVSSSKVKEIKPKNILLFWFIFTIYKYKWLNYLDRNTPIKKKVKICFLSLVQEVKLSVRWKKYLRKIHISDSITRKHLDALKNFLASKNKVCIILESDALIENGANTSMIIEKVFDEVKDKNYFFCNLGDGYPDSKIGVSYITNQNQNGIKTTKKPYSNTAVAYMVDRKMASLILLFASKPMFYPVIPPIDWFLNFVFVDCSTKKIEISGFYLNKNPFGHGSRDGRFAAWK